MDRIRGNPLHKLRVRELRKEETRLNSQLDQIRKEFDEIEKEKKKFREGIGADLFKREMLAREIEALDMEAELKLRNFTTAQRQLRFVKNLLIVKNYEQELKDRGLWKKLTSISQANLERVLIRISLDGKEFEEILNELNKPFEMEVAEIGEEVTEEEKKILDI